MPNCRICGRDGFDFCPDCQYKETHKQCQRCGTYEPAEELQYFEGLLLCPACLEGLEEEEREKEEKRDEGARKSTASEEETETWGVCSRCGRSADFLYDAGGMRLCQSCYENSPDYSSRGPSGSATPIRVGEPGAEEEKSLFRKMVEFFTGKEEKYEIGGIGQDSIEPLPKKTEKKIQEKD